MALVSYSIPSLWNGVSQQPAALRNVTQAEEQVNAISTIAEGLQKRPPTQNIAKIRTANVTGAYLHTINRDTTERFIVVVIDDDLEVYDLDGNSQTVNFPDGKLYLNSTDPQGNFSAVTIADFTFLVNKTITVGIQGTGSSTGTTLTGTVQEFSDLPASPTDGDLYRIIGQANNNFDDYYVQYSSTTTVWTEVAKPSLSIGTVTPDHTTEQFGLTDHGLVKNDIVRFTAATTLPAGITADTDYYVIEVDANNFQVAATFNGTAVNFTDNGTGAITVHWFEATELDPATLPHQLVYDGTEFTFSQVTWNQREVGDLESSPIPSFAYHNINDIFFYRNRLGLLSEENIILSRSGDFFNFWPKTVTAISDDDPIDVSASHTKVSILKHAVAYNEALLLFSDQTQFILSAAGTLTPSTVRLDVSTEFESSPKAAPVGAGQNVYFAVPRGSNTQIREYFVEPDTTTNDAANITAHVPTFVPQNVFKLTASTNEDILLGLSAQVTNKLFVYKYFWSGDEKVQSAWSTWEFDASDEILNVDIIEDIVYFVIQRSGDGVWLEKMQLTGDQVELDLGVVVHLDRRTSLTGVYSSGTDQTTWTLPYSDTGDFAVVLNEDWTAREGELVSSTHPTSTTVVATGDFSANPAYVGRIYSMTYTFSEQFVREARGSDRGAILNGMLMLRNLRLRYVDSGYFRVEVTPFARDAYSYPMTGKILGDSTSLIGDIAQDTGTFLLPILAQSEEVTIQIINDSYLPSQLMAADFEGEYVIRSRRV